MTIEEYTTKVLELDAQIAKLTTESNRLRAEAIREHYPQYKVGSKVTYDYYGNTRYGLIQSAELDKRNPFKVNITIQPTRKNFVKSNRVVLHPVTIRSEKLITIDGSNQIV